MQLEDYIQMTPLTQVTGNWSHFKFDLVLGAGFPCNATLHLPTQTPGHPNPNCRGSARFVATLVRGLGARTPPQTVLRLCVLLQDAELTRPASAPYRSDRCFALAQ